MPSMLGKIFSRLYFEMFFLFFPENRLLNFMQIISYGDNLYVISMPVFSDENKKNINLSLVKFAQRAVKVV